MKKSTLSLPHYFSGPAAMKHMLTYCLIKCDWLKWTQWIKFFIGNVRVSRPLAMRCVSFSSFEFRTQRKRFPCMDILHQERILLALAGSSRFAYSRLNCCLYLGLKKTKKYVFQLGFIIWVAVLGLCSCHDRGLAFIWLLLSARRYSGYANYVHAIDSIGPHDFFGDNKKIFFSWNQKFLIFIF